MTQKQKNKETLYIMIGMIGLTSVMFDLLFLDDMSLFVRGFIVGFSLSLFYHRK